MDMFLDERDLKCSSNSIKGFGQTKIVVARLTSLPLVLSEENHATTKIIDFIVVRFTSSYNAILGRTSLHEFEVVTSLHHQCLKFRIAHGICCIRGSQQTSRTYYMTKLDTPDNAPLARKRKIIKVLMENSIPRYLRKDPWSDEIKEEVEELKVGNQIKEVLRERIKEILD